MKSIQQQQGAPMTRRDVFKSAGCTHSKVDFSPLTVVLEYRWIELVLPSPSD